MENNSSSSNPKTPSSILNDLCHIHLGTKILPLKLELYSNSQPHRPNSNPLWKKNLNLFRKNSIPLDLLPKLTFKSLYQILLKANPNPLPTTNTYSLHTWSRLILLKPLPSLFSNFEIEISFRKAYKGYAWGCFFFKHNFSPVIQATFSVNCVSFF